MSIKRARTIPLDLIDPKLFWSKTEEMENGCINWTGCLDSYGYGRFKCLGSEWKAHRVSVALSGRVIPESMVIDHLCRNRRCVNPNHLEVTSIYINTARGVGVTAEKMRAWINGKCLNGHDLSVSGFHRAGPGRIVCAECDNERQRQYRLRKKEREIA